MIRFAALLALLALGACAVGPDYRSPAPQAPAQSQFVGSASPAFSAAEPSGRWWRLYNDPVLDGLIEQAIAANTDLRVAAADLARARALLRETRSQQLPSTAISGSANYGRQAGAGMGSSQPGGNSALYDVGFDVGYQLDLFGRIRRGIEAGRADVGAAQAAYDLARITVAAETARAYSDACSAGRQLEVAQRNVGVQAQVFDLTRRLLEGGRGTALETNQAASLLDQTRAAIPTLSADRSAALYRLSVLTGRPPAEFPRVVADCTTPPALTTPIPVGSGATLLSRRPDIREAERNLAAATARIGVATADLYPDISIGGSIGSTATSIGGLASHSGFRFGIGPLISWSFPNVGAARARIAQARASTEAALARFDGSWLNALQETESALTRYAGERERATVLRRARDESLEATRVARLRFEAGREDFQIVLDAERQLSTAESALASSEAQLSADLITLFLALGGGWQG
jgi:NodT family efflux transporter outer membrane factor (OMF) lipoprotein